MFRALLAPHYPPVVRLGVVPYPRNCGVDFSNQGDSMSMTRRELIKGLGLATVLGPVMAVAPKQLLASTPQKQGVSVKADYIPGTVAKKAGKDFKILQLTDPQLGVPGTLEEETLRQIKYLVEKTQPDLIISTGDNIQGPRDEAIVPWLVKALDSFGIPWTTVYGNHDFEGYKGLTWQSEQYANGKHSLFSRGPVDIEGQGNHIINIEENGKTFYSLFMIDSNPRDVDFNLQPMYGFICDNQIEWYEQQVQKIATENGEIVPSLAFFHVALPEYKDAYEAYEKSGFSATIGSGRNNEGVCSSKYNSGLFDKILKLKSTKGVFVGHDHLNASAVLHKDVLLTYGLKTSCGSYWKPEMQGGTLISINNKTKKVSVDFIHLENNAFKPLTDPKKIIELLDGKVSSYEEDNRRIISKGYTMAGDPWKKAYAIAQKTTFSPDL